MAQEWPKVAQKRPKMAQKWPKTAQKLAPAEKDSTDISAASAAFCISALVQYMCVGWTKEKNNDWRPAFKGLTLISQI